MAHLANGSSAGMASWVPIQDCNCPSSPLSMLPSGLHLGMGNCRGQRTQRNNCITSAQKFNSNNGSAFSIRPDPENSRSTGDKYSQNFDPGELFNDWDRGNSDSVSQPGENDRLRGQATPPREFGSVAKQINENFVDKSRGSLEGSHEPSDEEEDKSLISYEGQNEDDRRSKLGSPKKEEAASTTDTDSLWRSVFPSYMRSKDEDTNDEEDDSITLTGEGHGVHGAAAARAAAAAAASAKELESHVNSFTISSLPPSASAPPCSGAQNPSEGGKNLRELISDDPIWAAIRAEARLEAEREPLLSSFLYASILAHPCFERSLGFVLANRLKNPTLLATQLMDVFDDVFMNDASIRQAVRLDVQAVKDRDPSCRSYSSALLYLKGYHALQSYRVAHVLWNRGQMVLALALQSRISEVFAVDIHPAARIGKAILLDHGTGVVIGETAVVGDRVSMLQGVTLGGTGKVAGDRHPKIREGVLIGAGATILGNITVGRGAMVAAGSLVLKDVPPHSMVAGTPARVVGVSEEPTPSLTMKHDVAKNLWESLGDDSVCGGMGI